MRPPVGGMKPCCMAAATFAWRIVAAQWTAKWGLAWKARMPMPGIFMPLENFIDSEGSCTLIGPWP